MIPQNCSRFLPSRKNHRPLASVNLLKAGKLSSWRRFRVASEKVGIDTIQGFQNCEQKLYELETRLSAVRSKIDNAALQMEELTNCIRTFERIDRESGKEENSAVREFETISGISIVPRYNETQKKARKMSHSAER